VSCQLAAGESPADVAVYTSLLATCPGGMAYLSTILSPRPTSLTHSTTSARSALTTTSASTSTPSPAHTATSTTLATTTSTSPVVSPSQTTVTLVSGESKIKVTSLMAKDCVFSDIFRHCKTNVNYFTLPRYNFSTTINLICV